MKPVKIKPYLKKSKISHGGKSPIYISVTRNSKESLISVGHSIPLEAWNKEEGRVFEKKPKVTSKQEKTLTKEELSALKKEYSEAIVLYNAKTINTDIENRMSELSLLQSKLRVTNESLEVKNIKKIYTHDPDLDRSKNFIKFGYELAARLFKNDKIGTYKAYTTVIKKLTNFLGNEMLAFSSIDVKFLSNYRAHMKSEGLQISSIHNNFKTIKAIYNQAIKEEIIPGNKNPFKAFETERPGQSRKERLTIEELKSLENLTLKKESLLWHVRNYFFFAFNTAGMRIGDLIFLKWEHIIDGRIEYTMKKTGSFKSFRLSNKNMEILKFYYNENAKPSHYVFPLLSNNVDYSDSLFLFNQKGSKTALVNSALKDLAKMAGIRKNLTTHIARHTFGNIARQKNVNLFDLKNMFAHDSIKTTEMYLASLDYETQDASMEKVLENL